MRRAAVLLGALALVCAASSEAGTSSTGPTVKVWFLEGEQMAPLERSGTTVADAIGQLLAGPTSAEYRRGIRTSVPTATKLLHASVAHGVATVDLGRGFVAGPDGTTFAALSQVVFTATGIQGAKKVRVLIDGRASPALVQGVDTSGPLTVASLSAPSEPLPKTPQVHGTIPFEPQIEHIQERLVELGYLVPTEVDGENGPATQSAVLAFQKWEGLTRDGVVGPQTLAALATAQRPVPITVGGPGKRIEVLLDRQVALAIDDNQVVRVIHVSTGKPSTPTPPGSYTVYSKLSRWWSVPFREWLLWALPFNKGIAIHQFAEVPAVAASHGCVRNTFTTSKWIYDFAQVGMPITVIASSE